MRSAACTRAMMSVPPPAENGTTMRTGFCCQGWAAAMPAASSDAADKLFMIIPMFTRLLRLDARFAHHPRPLGALLAQHNRECLGGAVDHRAAVGGEALCHLGG